MIGLGAQVVSSFYVCVSSDLLVLGFALLAISRLVSPLTSSEDRAQKVELGASCGRLSCARVCVSLAAGRLVPAGVG